MPSGIFEGERLSADVLDDGNNWQNARSDGRMTLDVRLVLKTRDESFIGMTYKGIRQGQPEAWPGWNGEIADPASYYFRIAPFVEA